MSQDTTGISPELLEKCRELGQYFTIEIKRDRQDGKLEMKYVPTKPCPYVDQATLVEEFSNQVVWGHAMLFDMKGQIADGN
ncbi:MAG: hypothetical protein KKF26_06140 [Chloroflexi bacterium]|nr:hypothetical protein [Chloroflexota bacterium]